MKETEIKRDRIVIRRPGLGCYIAETQPEALAFLDDETLAMLEGGEHGEALEITTRSMTDDEVASLVEFTGW